MKTEGGNAYAADTRVLNSCSGLDSVESVAPVCVCEALLGRVLNEIK
jgi:hypothetical protein